MFCMTLAFSGVQMACSTTSGVQRGSDACSGVQLAFSMTSGVQRGSDTSEGASLLVSVKEVPVTVLASEALASEGG